MKMLEWIIDVIDAAAMDFAEFMGPVMLIVVPVFLIWQVFFR